MLMNDYQRAVDSLRILPTPCCSSFWKETLQQHRKYAFPTPERVTGLSNIMQQGSLKQLMIGLLIRFQIP
jgi:hypothetical protein